MFDIGFLELLVIAIIGLVVMGPERLPGAVRTGALWLGRLRRSFSQIKREIEREIDADEIRQQLYNEDILQALKESKQQLDEQLNFDSEVKLIDDELKRIDGDTAKPDDKRSPSRHE